MRTRLSLVAAAWSIGGAIAAAQQPVVPALPIGQGADIGIRATSVSGDAARFQRFRDLGDGAFLERLRFERTGSRWLFELGADHAGRRDQRYRAQYRNSGRVALSFEWDQVPLFISGDTRTLFSNESGVLRVADEIQQGIQTGAIALANVTGQATPFDLRSRRDIAAFGLVYRALRDVDVKFNLKSARREGTMPFGATFGQSNVAELPAPIDTRTTDVKAGVEWARQAGSIRIAYDGSRFDNALESLVWDSPWRLTDIATAGSQGRLTLWPDSTMHGISAAGSVKLPAQSRATANITLGSWQQNQRLLPFTINTAIAQPALPRQTAEAEARTLAMNYTFTSRPVPYVWLNARFRFHDFDNRTPHFAVDQYVRADSALTTLVTGGPEPLSATRRNVDIDASFTPIPFTAVRVGYSRDWTDRTFRVFARTTENVFKTSLDSTNFGWVTLRAVYERAVREGSGLEEHLLTTIGEQPAMRQFDVAGRDRSRVTALVQVTPMSALALSASAAMGTDDYAESGFGLRDNENRSYSVTLDLVPLEQVAAGLSYSRETYSARQQSRAASPGVQFLDPTRNWFVDASDRVHTVGASLDLLKAMPRTDLRFGYGWTRSRAAYVYGVPADSSLPALVQLPSILNETQTGTMDLRYFLTERLALGAVFWYDRYQVEDYALGPGTINRLDLPSGSLVLGSVYRPYLARSAWLRLMYLW